LSLAGSVNAARVPGKSSCTNDTGGQNSCSGSRPRKGQSSDDDYHTQHDSHVSGKPVSPLPDTTIVDRPWGAKSDGNVRPEAREKITNRYHYQADE
jgi:hypothetical protein